jgi:hypothetical protein
LMNNYILDTNICIYIINQSPQNILKKFHELDYAFGKRTAWEFPDLNTFANIMTPKKYIQLSIYHCN